MLLPEVVEKGRALVTHWVWKPLTQFLAGLNSRERPVLYVLLGCAVLLGYWFGRRRAEANRGGWLRFRRPRFQNHGELLVARLLRQHFPPPEYHLLNHITLQMDDGTTQVDHILVSRYGVFVIETKDYTGWIFGSATNPRWTKVHYRFKVGFQNPIHQNYRHVLAVRAHLDFLPPDAIHSLVVFTGNAEFKTEVPPGVVMIGEMCDWVRRYRVAVMTPNRMQFCVGRLETARLTLSGRTDVEHVEALRLRFGADLDDG